LRGGEDRALQECNPSAPARARKGNGFGSAAVPGRINTTSDPAPVSITQILRPTIHRLGAGKNARAPARGGKGNGFGSAAVLGRINVTTDPTTRLDHANAAPEHPPAGMPKQRVCPHIGIRLTAAEEQSHSGGKTATRLNVVR